MLFIQKNHADNTTLTNRTFSAGIAKDRWNACDHRSGWLFICSRARQSSKAGTFLLNGYWPSFYAMSHSDGFRRRAIVRSIFREFEPNGGSIVAVNVLSGVILSAYY